jgi:allophanate hydrolase
MDIASLQTLFLQSTLTPAAAIAEIYRQIRSEGERPIWISLVPEKQNLARARELESSDTQRALPLYGVPFAVKDNLDVAGLPTTAGCPAYAYPAQTTATVVQRLLDAGAILIGKTNMDQFATGLVGTRTPYGVCSSVFHSDYISGGSSSGSAVAVACGMVSFSLGTDTAGSGRVPAAFNQLIGLKPTRGWVSTHGLVPACRSLDCVSIFAETCSDADRAFRVVRGYDARDPYSREPGPGQGAAPWSASSFRFGVPAAKDRNFFGDAAAAACYQDAVHALVELGGEAVAFDYAPFRVAASLLYSGPWVAERLAALEEFAAHHSAEMEPTVRKVISGANLYSAVDVFRAAYELQALRSKTDTLLDQVDFLLLPTAPTHYRIADVQESPLELNSNLGYYTNFVNLLDLAAVAVPAGFKANRLPFGVSLIGKAFTDSALLLLGDRLHRSLATTLGGSERLLVSTPCIPAAEPPTGCVMMAVVGAHLAGQQLNWQLTARKARLVRSLKTQPDYRLYSLPDSVPKKPGLVYSPGFAGPGIEVEVWAMPEDTVGSFLEGIPAPLSLGTVRLEDGTKVKGFLCEPAGIDRAEEISSLGGWREYLRIV